MPLQKEGSDSAIDTYEKLNYTETARPVFLGIDGADVGLQAVRDEEYRPRRWRPVYQGEYR